MVATFNVTVRRVCQIMAPRELFNIGNEIMVCKLQTFSS